MTGSEDGPVEGLKLAAIQEPISYLLYAARWFPTTGYMTDRFTAEMHIRVPQGMRVFASGSAGSVAPRNARQRQTRRPIRLQLDQARISRNRDCGPLRRPGFSWAPVTCECLLTISHQASANQLAQTATKQYDFFTDALAATKPRVST